MKTLSHIRNHHFWRRSLFCLLFLLTAASAPAEQSPEKPHSPQILTVDIPFVLFTSLASYQELTEAEYSGRVIHEEIIPVIESIISEMKKKRDRIEALNLSSGENIRLSSYIRRMERHLKTFQDELIFRRKVVEFNQLVEEQQKLMEE